GLAGDHRTGIAMMRKDSPPTLSHPKERAGGATRSSSLRALGGDVVEERCADHFQGRETRRVSCGGRRRGPGRHPGRACVSIGRGVQGARARGHWYGLIRVRARGHLYWLTRVRARGHLYGLNGLRPYTWYLYQGENPGDCTHQDPSPENACNRHESYSCNRTAAWTP